MWRYVHVKKAFKVKNAFYYFFGLSSARSNMSYSMNAKKMEHV